MAIMDRRLKLQDILEKVLGSDHVYFNAPSSLRMQYPAILYSRTNIDKTNADNIAYLLNAEYQIILIDSDPDSSYIDSLCQLPKCRHVRHYESDGLSHDVFQIIF